jgi:hypothetical protein
MKKLYSTFSLCFKLSIINFIRWTSPLGLSTYITEFLLNRYINMKKYKYKFIYNIISLYKYIELYLYFMPHALCPCKIYTQSCWAYTKFKKFERILAKSDEIWSDQVWWNSKSPEYEGLNNLNRIRRDPIKLKKDAIHLIKSHESLFSQNQKSAYRAKYNKVWSRFSRVEITQIGETSRARMEWS